MGGPLTTCTTCGAAISDGDLESGSAITVLGKSYCSSCKNEAVKNIRLEDLVPRTPRPIPSPVRAPAKAPPAPEPPRPGSPPVPKAPPPAKPAGVDIVEIDLPAQLPPEKAAPKAVAAPVRPAPHGRTPPPRRKPAAVRRRPTGRALAVAGALVGTGVVLAAVLIFLSQKGPGPDRPPALAGPGPKPPDPPSSPENPREAPAREAYQKALSLSRHSDVDFDVVLAAADAARPHCLGTSFQPKLEELRIQVQKQKDQTEAQKKIKGLLEELKAAVAADAGFRRFGELQPRFQQARELAARAGPAMIAEISKLHEDYASRYEGAAQPHYERIKEAAPVLAGEQRYDAALAMIETFPPHLRLSGAWKDLERLKQDIERRKRAAPSKK